MHKALVNFVDLRDNNHRYHAGDSFPREGYEVSDDRIAELCSDQNKLGKPVIAEEKPVDEAPVEKPKKGRKKNDAI